MPKRPDNLYRIVRYLERMAEEQPDKWFTAHDIHWDVFKGRISINTVRKWLSKLRRFCYDNYFYKNDMVLAKGKRATGTLGNGPTIYRLKKEKENG